MTGHTHSRGGRYLVVDDLLAEAEFTALAEEFARIPLKPALSTIDPFLDGFGYHGTGAKHPLTALPDTAPAWQRTVAERITAAVDVLDRDGAEHLDITFTPWAYPDGSRLSWHNDAGERRVGAFVLFAHRAWSASWGGGLALVDAPSGPDTADGDGLMDSAVHPTLILPRPNRLVVFRSETMHSVQRVDRAAGDRLRRTWTGFLSVRHDAATA
ncbi:2OG-Fe(II) oxygenase [Kitasatospora sp. NPDC007106]|uniref:2OG-Fe(II) oxygenase n=1 Tax=Kitasatospora sp. NPDC007106 TaxID=3156914 RepID=UPI0033C060F3